MANKGLKESTLMMHLKFALGFKIERPFILSSVVTRHFQSGLGALQSVGEVRKPLFNQFSV
jgi:hypothetical protein